MTNKFLAQIALVIFCLMAGSNWAEAKKAPSKVNGETVFALAQRSSSLGKQIIYVSPRYLRLESKRTGCTFLVKPPGTTVEIVNDGKKAYFQADSASWRDTSSKAVDQVKDRYKGFVSGQALEQATICGLVAYKYTKRVSKSEEVDYWLARDIAISAGTREILEKTLGDSVPIDRYPLRIVAHKKSKDKVKTSVYLDTDEFRRTAVSTALFSAPMGYTKARSEIEVLGDFDEAELDGINSIIYKMSESGELPSKQELNGLKSTFLKNGR